MPKQNQRQEDVQETTDAQKHIWHEARAETFSGKKDLKITADFSSKYVSLRVTTISKDHLKDETFEVLLSVNGKDSAEVICHRALEDW